jgi:signal transduction protein with GAF and PtsI domain
MNDTSPEMEKQFRAMIMARSGAERMNMAFSMLATARELIEASLPTDLSVEERRRRLFERMYADEISAGTLENPFAQK